MSCAIVCNTPLQILGAMSILFNSIEGCGKDTDIFIINEFTEAADVGSVIEQEGLCRKIFICQKLESTNGFRQKAETLFRIISVRHVLKCYGLKQIDILKDAYSKVFAGDGNFLGLSLRELNSRAELIFYDDGIISYRQGNPLIDDQSKLYRIICSTLKRGLYGTSFSRMYLFAPSMSMSDISESKYNLPVLKDNKLLLEKVERIFRYKKNIPLESRRFVLLGQMISEIEGYCGISYYRMIKDGYGDKFILRKHPRQGDIEEIDILTDVVNNPWELDCIYSVTDEHVLVALCTSSQFTPKLISDKEPYVIFTYKLFLGDKGQRVIHIDDGYVDMLRGIYENPKKIFVPETFEEYDGILEQLA